MNKDKVRIKTITGKEKQSLQYSTSGMVYMLSEEEYAAWQKAPEESRYRILQRAIPLHKAFPSHGTRWEDTRSRSRLHGGLLATSTYELPDNTILAWSFILWRDGLPYKKVEGAKRVGELTKEEAVLRGTWYAVWREAE